MRNCNSRNLNLIVDQFTASTRKVESCILVFDYNILPLTPTNAADTRVETVSIEQIPSSLSHTLALSCIRTEIVGCQ